MKKKATVSWLPDCWPQEAIPLFLSYFLLCLLLRLDFKLKTSPLTCWRWRRKKDKREGLREGDMKDRLEVYEWQGCRWHFGVFYLLLCLPQCLVTETCPSGPQLSIWERAGAGFWAPTRVAQSRLSGVQWMLNSRSVYWEGDSCHPQWTLHLNSRGETVLDWGELCWVLNSTSFAFRPQLLIHCVFKTSLPTSLSLSFP